MSTPTESLDQTVCYLAKASGNGDAFRTADYLAFARHVLEYAGIPELVEAAEEARKDLVAIRSSVEREVRRNRQEWWGVPDVLDKRIDALHTALARVRGERERCDWCDGRGLGAYLADYSGLDQHCTICGGSGEVDPSQLTETQRACIAAARARRREG